MKRTKFQLIAIILGIVLVFFIAKQERTGAWEIPYQEPSSDSVSTESGQVDEVSDMNAVHNRYYGTSLSKTLVMFFCERT